MKNIIIEERDVNKRLDKFLSQLTSTEKEFSDFSRGEFIRQIKAGRVLVNGLKTKPSYRLCDGDDIELNMKKIEDKIIPNSRVEFEKIFEDENIVVVNKTAGIQVHPDYNEKFETLVNGLIAKYPEILNVQEENSHLSNLRPGIVHRLDKDTSGLIVVARNKKTFNELKRMFKEREVEKKYLAITYGIPTEETGIIDKPLARTSNYRRQTVAGKKTKTKIREATTEYKLSKKLAQDLSLLEVFPKTGRTHQIRVHLFSIGHPIIGDKLYRNKKIKAIQFVDRHMLHASEIKFKLFGKNYEFSAEPPSDFKSFLK
jgi:23S rRNA pseudouridine1911/1915/1917 synthase